MIEKVTQARTLLPEVEVPMEIRLKISQVSVKIFLCCFLTFKGRSVLSLMLTVCAVTLLRRVPLALLQRIGTYEPSKIKNQLLDLRGNHTEVLKLLLMRMCILLFHSACGIDSERTQWPRSMKVPEFTRSSRPFSATKLNKF